MCLVNVREITCLLLGLGFVQGKNTKTNDRTKQKRIGRRVSSFVRFRSEVQRKDSLNIDRRAKFKSSVYISSPSEPNSPSKISDVRKGTNEDQ